MSESVSKALYLTGGNAASETAMFISKMDQFFDCLNVSSLTMGKFKRKPFLNPYRSKDDFCIKVHMYMQTLSGTYFSISCLILIVPEGRVTSLLSTVEGICRKKRRRLFKGSQKENAVKSRDARWYTHYQ